MKKISLAVFMVSMVALLAACGGGGGGGGSTGTQAGQYSIVTAVRYTAPASSCPNGGISVDAGVSFTPANHSAGSKMVIHALSFFQTIPPPIFIPSRGSIKKDAYLRGIVI